MVLELYGSLRGSRVRSRAARQELLLFPPWLRHGVEPVGECGGEADGEAHAAGGVHGARVAISFNLGTRPRHAAPSSAACASAGDAHEAEHEAHRALLDQGRHERGAQARRVARGRQRVQQLQHARERCLPRSPPRLARRLRRERSTSMVSNLTDVPEFNAAELRAEDKKLTSSLMSNLTSSLMSSAGNLTSSMMSSAGDVTDFGGSEDRSN